MDNNIQTSQSPVSVAKESRSNSIMNLILFVVVGAIIGAGISVSLLFLTKKEEGINQWTKIRILSNLKKSIKKNFPKALKSKDYANIDFYLLRSETGDGIIAIGIIDNLPVQEATKILKYNNYDEAAGKSLSEQYKYNGVKNNEMSGIIQARYSYKNGKWILYGKPIISVGINLYENFRLPI